jgi:hypothetical protein
MYEHDINTEKVIEFLGKNKDGTVIVTTSEQLKSCFNRIKGIYKMFGKESGLKLSSSGISETDKGRKFLMLRHSVKSAGIPTNLVGFHRHNLAFVFDCNEDERTVNFVISLYPEAKIIQGGVYV